MKKIILTGDRPTGKLHLGHFVGSLSNRIRLQDDYDQFIMIADVQALTDNADNPLKVRNNIMELALDYMAAGIDPKRSTIFIQSLIPELAELTVYFLNLVTLSRLQLNPTIKDEMKQKGYGSNIPVGFLVYPISQAADILGFKADLVPAGADQLPMIEQANEIAEKFNRIYEPVFPKVAPMMSDFSRLLGTDGQAKMSKSLGNVIYLSDSFENIKEKVMSMYTDSGHLKVSDPGKVEGNMVFYYLDVFDKDREGLEDLKNRYQKGGVGDVEVKRRLIAVLDGLLKPIREKRELLAQDKAGVMRILEEGSAKARDIVAKNLREVKKAMKIDYI
jgi:tryptophanyl-tRNA synthetase